MLGQTPGQAEEGSAAKGGAIPARLADAWPDLPPAVQQAILNVIDATVR
jgi:hypothetical protein